ncbi:putative fungal-specific transcription factor [Triangularia verruculosa]|uniref:Fungal-specific transcription factor n=1 Tax=Triangularia verruculosa TaxID=2587418 RepID=A0AAN6XC80_9PEZI|nr:putative fungal-specific transcription factor [Triangularia verruculosa]
MAEPQSYANPQQETGTPPSDASAAKLACYACKRRKVKCDRQLPICSLCQKLSGQCEYPTHAEKPGPKTGPHQGSKRRRLDHASVSNSVGHGLSLGLPGGHQPSTSFELARRSSAAVSSPSYTTIQDDARTRADDDLRGVDVTSPLPNAESSTRSQPTSAPIFSRIMYPSHEAQTRPQSPSTVDASPGHQDNAIPITVQTVCDALKISRATYDLLMESYFTNMTSFTLFRPGSIEPKFAMMQFHSDAEALIAAIFSFSTRHCREHEDCPSPTYFAKIAYSKLDESVDSYGDHPPPFWLLQAGILVTFYQLTMSVRSRSWKKLGDCIRYSYDLNLHMVDANHDPARDRNPANIQRWSLMEERRRAWWAVWEMDVFAGTIRRLPTAIDPEMNLTMLPVPDSCWFNDVYQESCFLVQDPSLRWKHLAQSGNQSAKAWFVVMNSLMRNTQRIVYPAGSALQSMNENHAETNQDELNIMANTLYCTVTSFPASLVYQGETLDFRPKASAQASPEGINPRQEHADKYSLHLMTQLCRFMIYHHKICARTPWLAHQKASSDGTQGGEANNDPRDAQQANSEWSNYVNASDEIVTVVRNSSRDHYKFVNPFLVNTLWFAAAAQCACKVFGPASFNKRLTISNLDLLKLTIDRYISFWGGMENLKGKLARIETALQSLMPGNGRQSDENHRAQQERRQQYHAPHLQGSNGASINDLATVAMQRLPGVTGGHGTGTVASPLLVNIPGIGPTQPPPPPNPWSTFGPADVCDFSHPPHFATGLTPGPGQTFYGHHGVGGDPMDFSPFGLEELLMASIMMDT